MIWKCLVLFLLVVDLCRGSIFQTRTILEDVAFPIKQQRVQEANGTYYRGRQGKNGMCYRNIADTIFETSQDNNFLDMVNFMEFVQQTKSGTVAESDDAKNFLEVAKAAMESDNTFVAQENIARALGAIDSYGSRRKRSDDGSFNAAELFAQFREAMGEEKFKDVLHLNKKVTMAFVIDTSSSMENDMGHVREYINQLLQEQDKAGVDAEYIVTTFADRPAARPEPFKTAQEVKSFISNLRPSIGGDCEERTCYGIMSALYKSNFMRVRNSVMYVFTDASSKDCLRAGYSISRTLSFLKAPVFFILLDSCKPTIDSSYVQMSQKSGGFSLLIKDNGVYNITDTVNGAFDKDALVCGEASDDSRSVVGQGRFESQRKKRNTDGEIVTIEELEKSILVDTSIEKFKVIVSITPPAMLNKVKLEKPVNGNSYLCGVLRNNAQNVRISTSIADNSVVFDVSTHDCPCTGEWKLKYPAEADSFTYSVKSSGEFLVGFESYFVDQIGTTSVANYAPCIGIEENLVIKLNQGEKVNITTLKAKIVGVIGSVVQWEGTPAQDEDDANAFVVTLTLPTEIGPEGFRVVLEGELIDGTKFQRISTNHFLPTTSCLRITDVGSYYALTPNRKTYIKVSITNHNDYEELYLLSCTNTENYDVTLGVNPLIITPGKRNKRSRSNPVVLKATQTAEFIVNIIAPKILKRGRTVTVTCYVTLSTDDQLLDMVRLTELETRFVRRRNN